MRRESAWHQRLARSKAALVFPAKVVLLMPSTTGEAERSFHPTAAETVSILAKAMAFKTPADAQRIAAAPFLPSDAECALVVEAYRRLKDREVRQAVLDMLVAASGPASP